ncbi:MAG: hypothetical protein HYX68_04035 [Planctomycetes bacterium]|nr:hypothetical protein [Planctomycetota bacterium]
MLEHSTLLINPWAKADGVAKWMRRITDGHGRLLGHVELSGDRAGSWLSWLRRSRLDVHETPDGSHLLSLTRSWSFSRSWDVYDSEDRHVGTLYTKTIVTGANDFVGVIQRNPHGVVGGNREMLASFAPNADASLELKFMEGTPANPFVRMLLLGSALTLDPIPPRQTSTDSRGAGF